MLGFPPPADSLSGQSLLPVRLLHGDSQSLPPLQVDRLLENPFLRELVLTLGLLPHQFFKGLRAAIALDAAHPAVLFGEIALRPTFVYMFRSFWDYGVVVPSGAYQQQVHPELAAAIARMSFRICPSCRAHVLMQETECWMCEADRVIAPTMEGFRGVTRLKAPAVLERAVFVPAQGLPVSDVAASVTRMEVPVGSLLVTASFAGEPTVRYYRIFLDGGDTAYLRVIRSGIRDFVSRVSAVEIFAEFPTVAPGFLSWQGLLSSEE